MAEPDAEESANREPELSALPDAELSSFTSIPMKKEPKNMIRLFSLTVLN
jgi:hypothetical protein